MSKPITSRWAAEQGVSFIKALRGRIEAMVGDDEQAIRDTIEGEVDVDPIMEKLIGLRQEAKAMAASRKELAQRYAEACKADEARAEKVETLILECLQASGQEQWKGAAGTASIRQGSWSCEILDATHIPLQYMKPVPNVAMIKEDLMAGKEVAGAHVIRGGDTLTIRLPSRKKGEDA